MLHPMHFAPPIFTFQVNNTQTIGGLFSTITGKTISVDWGDGSARSTYTSTDQAWNKDYGSAGDRTVRIFGSVVLTKFRMDVAGADISFDVANLPSGLTYLYVTGSNTLTGDIANLPSGLTYLSVTGSNTLTGNITNLPSGLTNLSVTGSNTLTGNITNLPAGLTYLYISGSNILTGNITNLPSGLTYLSVHGSNTLFGDITNLPAGLTYLSVTGSNTLFGDITNLPAGLTSLGAGGSNTLTGNITNLPSGLTYLSVHGSNTIVDYSGKTWITKPATFRIIPVGAGGLSTAEIDQLFIDFDDDLVWAAGNVITLTGTNTAPSAASAAARTNIVNEGCTITTN